MILLVLFIRGVTLEGAGDGLVYYLKPNVTKLQNPQVIITDIPLLLVKYFW